MPADLSKVSFLMFESTSDRLRLLSDRQGDLWLEETVMLRLLRRSWTRPPQPVFVQFHRSALAAVESLRECAAVVQPEIAAVSLAISAAPRLLLQPLALNPFAIEMASVALV